MLPRPVQRMVILSTPSKRVYIHQEIPWICEQRSVTKDALKRLAVANTTWWWTALTTARELLLVLVLLLLVVVVVVVWGQCC